MVRHRVVKLQVAAAVVDHIVSCPNLGRRVVHAASAEVRPILVGRQVDELVIAREAVTIVSKLDGQARVACNAAVAGNRNVAALATDGVIGAYAIENTVFFPVEDETASGAKDLSVVGGKHIQGGPGETGVRIKGEQLQVKIADDEDSGAAAVVAGLYEVEEGIAGDHLLQRLGDEVEAGEVLGREVGQNLRQLIIVKDFPVGGGGATFELKILVGHGSCQRGN